MRSVNAKAKDLQLLVDRHYLIKMEDWLYLEKHFYINNRNLRKDRIKPSNYSEYLERVTLRDNGSYTLVTKCQPNDDKWLPNDTKPQPNDTKMARNTIQYNTIQSNTIQDKVIETRDDLKRALRG